MFYYDFAKAFTYSLTDRPYANKDVLSVCFRRYVWVELSDGENRWVLEKVLLRQSSVISCAT